MTCPLASQMASQESVRASRTAAGTLTKNTNMICLQGGHRAASGRGSLRGPDSRGGCGGGRARLAERGEQLSRHCRRAPPQCFLLRSTAVQPCARARPTCGLLPGWRMQRLLGMFGVRGSQKRVFTILKDVTGNLKPVRCESLAATCLHRSGHVASDAHLEVHTWVQACEPASPRAGALHQWCGRPGCCTAASIKWLCQSAGLAVSASVWSYFSDVHATGCRAGWRCYWGRQAAAKQRCSMRWPASCTLAMDCGYEIGVI